MEKIAQAIGGVGILAVSAWLYMNGHQSGWVIGLGVFGALQAML